jgi:hypothetical protein
MRWDCALSPDSYLLGTRGVSRNIKNLPWLSEVCSSVGKSVYIAAGGGSGTGNHARE